MADEELELDVNEPEGKSKKMIIIIVVAILLLNGIGVGAWMFLGGSEDDNSSAANENEKTELAPLKYLTLVPEFIVNFGPGSKVRYLQVDLQIATREEDSLEMVGTYRPVLRNDILVVLSDVNYEDLKDRAGKEALQKRLLNTINKALVKATHTKKDDEKKDDEKKSDGLATEDIKGPIENVYYTSFIMQ